MDYYSYPGIYRLGAVFLSSGDISHSGGNTTVGIIAACISVFSYGGYIIGVRKSRAVQINSTVLTCYVMGIGALLFIICGSFTSGIRIVTDWNTWLHILGLALPATAISNMALIKAIQTHRSYPYVYLRSHGTSNSCHHRDARFSGIIHSKECYRNCSDSNSSYYRGF